MKVKIHISEALRWLRRKPTIEVGFLARGLYSAQNIFNPRSGQNDDLFAGYAGFHLEPIFLEVIGQSFLPCIYWWWGRWLCYRDFIESDFDPDEDDFDAVFVLEPDKALLIFHVLCN